MTLEEKEKKIDALIAKLETRIEEITKIQNKVIAKARKMDSLYSLDISKQYGFDGENMYYIGVASGRVYKKPTNEKILALINNIKGCSNEHIREINCHFMDIKYKKL